MSRLSNIPELISIELEEKKDEVALICVTDLFQAKNDAENILIKNINDYYYNTNEKIFLQYWDEGGRRIGYKSSNQAILDAYDIVKNYFKNLNVSTLVLYFNETSYGRFLHGTFPLIAKICNELNIITIVIIPEVVIY